MKDNHNDLLREYERLAKLSLFAQERNDIAEEEKIIGMLDRIWALMSQHEHQATEVINQRLVTWFELKDQSHGGSWTITHGIAQDAVTIVESNAFTLGHSWTAIGRRPPQESGYLNLAAA